MAFGRELQLEREKLSISLDSIAAGTKVPQRHLRALELDHFEELPGGVFNKGIVRSYCQYLGLDEHEWLQRFPATAPVDDSPAWAEFAENVSRTRDSARSRMHLRWWGLALMLLTLAALAWTAWHFVLQPSLS